MISQILSVLYAVSIALTNIYRTSLGTISVHHINPSLFFGYQFAAKDSAKIATPEKALVDFLYLGPARTRLFKALPELELPRGFKANEARKIIRRIRSIRRRSHVRRQFEQLLQKAAS